LNYCPTCRFFNYFRRTRRFFFPAYPLFLCFFRQVQAFFVSFLSYETILSISIDIPRISCARTRLRAFVPLTIQAENTYISRFLERLFTESFPRLRRLRPVRNRFPDVSPCRFPYPGAPGQPYISIYRQTDTHQLPLARSWCFYLFVFIRFSMCSFRQRGIHSLFPSCLPLCRYFPLTPRRGAHCASACRTFSLRTGYARLYLVN